MEEQVADLWRDLLGIESVAPDSHFFHLGGSSLTAVSLSRRLSRLTGQDKPIAVVFEHPTLRNLARAYEGEDHRGAAVSQATARGLSRRALRRRAYA